MPYMRLWLSKMAYVCCHLYISGLVPMGSSVVCLPIRSQRLLCFRCSNSRVLKSSVFECFRFDSCSAALPVNAPLKSHCNYVIGSLWSCDQSILAGGVALLVEVWCKP